MIAARWGIVFVACVVLASCYGTSGGQAKEGQSHWLDRCSTRTGCDDGQICACGVCTIACTESATCGAEGLCADIEGSQCAETHEAEQVCLASCSRDADCRASGIECRTGACVSASALVETDAGVSGGATALIDLEVVGLGETVGVLRFVLTDDSVIWQTGLPALEGNYIYRMDLSSRAITVLAALPAATDAQAQLEVQGDVLVYGVGPDIHTVDLQNLEEVWSVQPGAHGRTLWRTDAEHVYYVLANQPDTVVRMRTDQTSSEPFYVSDDGAAIRALAIDVASVYVEEEPVAIGSETRVRRVAKDGSAAVTLIEPLRAQIGFFTIPMAFLVHDGFLIFDRGMNMSIVAIPLAGGPPLRLMSESDVVATATHASHGYVYYAKSSIPVDPTGQHSISRVSIASQESEQLHSTTVFTNQVAEANGYLYWVERGRLLRKAL
jgi:hypothetical protein